MKINKVAGLLVFVAIVVAIWVQFNLNAKNESQASSQAATSSLNAKSVAVEPAKGALDRVASGADGKPSATPKADAKGEAGGDRKGAASGKPKGAEQGAANGAQKAASGQPGSGNSGRGSGRSRSTLIVSEPASEALVNDRLNAVGSGAAVSSVSVVPLSAGTLVEVLVSSGQQVEKGDVLARLDEEEQALARDRAARTAQITMTNENRTAKLFQSRTASAADLDNAKALRADAELALREAELKLQRRNITAPISGVVGLIAVDTGNYVTAQTELVTIDDRSTIIVEFWVPERFANQIAIGQSLEATALANPSKVYEGVISGIDSRIETDSRTLPVEARLDNSSDSLRPGMSFELQLGFTGQNYASVNPLAVQWDSKGSYVWRVVEEKAQRIPVKIIQRNPESVLVDGDIAADDQVVIEGLLSLRPGATVRVQGGGS